MVKSELWPLVEATAKAIRLAVYDSDVGQYQAPGLLATVSDQRFQSLVTGELVTFAQQVLDWIDAKRQQQTA